MLQGWSDAQMEEDIMPILRRAEKLMENHPDIIVHEKQYQPFHIQIFISKMLRVKALDTPWLEVRKSKNGMGVFATCDIPQGLYLTFYPFHVVKYNRRFMRSCDQKIDDQIHGIGLDNGAVIYGDARNYKNETFIGHMINDPCLDVTITNNEEFDWLVRYAIAAASFSNVKFIQEVTPSSDCVWTSVKSVKPIPAGSELLVPYCPSFWIGTKKFEELKPLLRQQYHKMSKTKQTFLAPKLKMALSQTDFQYFMSDA